MSGHGYGPDCSADHPRSAKTESWAKNLDSVIVDYDLCLTQLFVTVKIQKKTVSRTP